MSDTPAFYPPPPPPNLPPPPYQGAGFAAPPYQPPQAFGATPAAYQPQWSPAPAAAVGLGGAGALLYQFGGAAGWSVGFGLVSIVSPFVTGFYFPVMPIVGGLNAIRAMKRGRLIGGAVGLALNLLGGLVSILAYASTRIGG